MSETSEWLYLNIKADSCRETDHLVPDPSLEVTLYIF